jgi:hypothetical protein
MNICFLNLELIKVGDSKDIEELKEGEFTRIIIMYLLMKAGWFQERDILYTIVVLTVSFLMDHISCCVIQSLNWNDGTSSVFKLLNISADRKVRYVIIKDISSRIDFDDQIKQIIKSQEAK